MTGGSVPESLTAGLAGAALGGIALLPVGLSPLGASIAGLNGLISGRCGIYDWGSARGICGFALDSTWGMAGTAIGLGLHAIQRLRGDGDFRPDLSERQGHHVYAGGVSLKRGFAVTWGNVISNAGGRHGLDSTTAAGRRRRRFVRDHEGLHVWQNRVLGPIFPVAYVGWMGVAGTVGLVIGMMRRRDVFRTIETLAYYDNPFEVMAYRNDGKWPPGGALDGFTWRLPPITGTHG